MRNDGPDSRAPVNRIQADQPVDQTETIKLPSVPQAAVRPKGMAAIVETPRTLPPSNGKMAPLLPKLSKKESANIHELQEQCRRFCLSLFATEQRPIRSIGFTSSISGEGKSFLAAVTARVLAHDSNDPVTLVECNWEHPSLHEAFAIPATPGLAEWLKGTCYEDEIRYRVGENLTVIPAGNGAQEAVRLLRRLQQRGLNSVFKRTDGMLIVDLPSVITSSYGLLATSLVDTVALVVRSEVTTSRMLTEACEQLKDLSVQGIILNQGGSRIPRWLQQLL